MSIYDFEPSLGRSSDIISDELLAAHHSSELKRVSFTGQRPVELIRYPFVRRPAVCPSVSLSVCLSVNNMLFLYLLCKLYTHF